MVLLVALGRPAAVPGSIGVDVVVGGRDGEPAGAPGVGAGAKRQPRSLAQRSRRSRGRGRSDGSNLTAVLNLPDARGYPDRAPGRSSRPRAW